MQIKRLVALVAVSVLGGLCAASCVQDPDTPAPAGTGASATPTPADANESTSNEAEGVTLQGELREDVGETAQAFGKVIHCQESETNADCMERCAEAGIACAPQRRHPNNFGVGLGDLYACADVPHSCVYSYSNGDRCWFVTTLLFPVCRYSVN